MNALDSILLPAKNVSLGGASAAPAAMGVGATGESFDQVMTRALFPSPTDKSAKSSQRDAGLKVSTKVKPNSISSAVQRRVAQAMSTASAKTTSVAGGMSHLTGQPSAQTAVSAAEADGPKDSVQDRGDAAAAASQNVSPAAAVGLPDRMSPLATTLLTIMPVVLSMSAAEQKSSPDVKNASSSSRTTTQPESGTSGNLAAHRRTKNSLLSTGTTLKSEVELNPTDGGIISSIPSARWSKNAMSAGDLAVEKNSAQDIKSAPMPVKDLPVNAFKPSDFSAATLAEPAVDVDPTVQSPAAEAISSAKASVTTPVLVSSEPAAAAVVELAASKFQSVSLPVKDLPVHDFKPSDFSAAIVAEPTTDVDPTVQSPAAEVISSAKASVVTPVLVPAETANAAVVELAASKFQSASMPVKDLPVNAFKPSDFSAAIVVEPTVAVDPTVQSPAAEVISSAKASVVTPVLVPAETANAAVVELAASKFQSASMPVKDLPASDFKPSDFSAAIVAEPTADVDPTVQPPVTEVISSAKASVAATISAPTKAAGTPVAKLPMPMEKNEKTNKVAGLTGVTEKVLPDDASLTVSGNNLPAAEDSFIRVSPHGESDSLIMGLSSQGTGSAAASVADSIPVSSVVDLQARALERTHDMIALQSVRLVDVQLDSLHVVIKPGAGMQLSLEMHQHGDVINAQAVLQSGDFGVLNQHWPELQQRLELRGVHLAPLASGENLTANCGGNGFQSPQREFAHQSPVEASAFAEFALAGPAARSSVPALATPVIHHGWQTWA